MNKTIINQLNTLPTTSIFNKSKLLSRGVTAKNEVIGALSQYVNLNDVKVNFASLNRTKDCFWYTPNPEYLKEDWLIILNDTKNEEVDLILIDKNTIDENELYFRQREGKTPLLHLELKKDSSGIIDLKSNYNFSKDHFVKRISY